MKIFSIVPLLFQICFIPYGKCGRDYNGYQVLEITLSTDDNVSALRAIESSFPEVSFWNFPSTGKATVAVPPGNVADFTNQLQNAGLTFVTKQQDLGNSIETEKIQVQQQSRLSPEGFDIFNYNRHSQINDYLDELAAICADKGLFCQTFSIGNSYEGRPLKVIKIGSSPSRRPAIWIDAGIHAREWIAPATAIIIANRLVYKYGSDPETRRVVDGFDWYILPSANPDGYEYSWSEDRLWRKTRSPNENSDCVGTDPNRNWGFHWMEIGASSNPCSDIYGGPYPFSEVENQAISSFLLNHTIDFQVYLSLHCYGQFWLTPWGFTDDVPDDYDMLEELGQDAARAIKEVYGTEFTVGSVTGVLYPAAGGSDDWAKAAAKIKFSYTVELRDDGQHGFILPTRQIGPTGRETWIGIRQAAISLLNTKK